MRKFLLLLILIPMLLLNACTKENRDFANAEQQGGDNGNPLPSVIRASVAGSFYPADPKQLKHDIDKYLGDADIPQIHGNIIAAIVPHAGYAYSAPVAAYAFKAISANLEQRWQLTDGGGPEAMFVVAFSHRVSYPHVSVYPEGAMQTPLGLAAVHKDLARQFMTTSRNLSFSEQVFIGEHSAEVQLPFLQMLLPNTPIVPILFGRQNVANIEAVAQGLEAVSSSHRILVVATTDLSHYHSYDQATALDKETLDLLLEGNPRQAAQFFSEHPDRMCGIAPVLAVLSYAETKNAEPVLLKYANSGDTSGQKDAVVGYAAIIFVQKDEPQSGATRGPESGIAAPEAGDSEYLTEEDKKTLLKIARQSVELYVRDRNIYEPDPPAGKHLRENGAAFVTLTKNGQLRGCIGHLESKAPLYQTVAQMAIAAASQDPRFPPVRPEELDSLHIEISVNTPLMPVAGPDEIVLGKHGVVISKGFRQGVFLPQVATETGWTKEEFLRNLCVQKAGLPADAYENGARLLVFTSVVFEEEK